jgi:predicted HTH transcriptional regulator
MIFGIISRKILCPLKSYILTKRYVDKGNGIEWNLSKLKANGLLERIGSNKSGHWKVIQKNK